MNQMPTSQLVTSAMADGVLTLTLGAAPAHPLSTAMIRSLHTAVQSAADDPEIGAIVVYGAGKIYCAGHDLKEISRHRSDPDQGRAYVERLFAECGEMMQAIAQCPKPSIAMIEGVATAGGLQLAASCDLAFATAGASFSLPGVNNGGFCSTPAVAVGRNIARKHLMEMLLSGERFDAEWALSVGLINRILPADTLAQFTQDFAAKLATRNLTAIADGKRATYQQLEMTLGDAYAHATPAMVNHFMDPERLAREPKK